MRIRRLAWWASASSHVMPMPPCNWMASCATSVPMRPMLTLAADRARSRARRSPPRTAAALMTAERACSTSSSTSAMRCCRAWKLPMGTPNCLRVCRYSMVMRLAASIERSKAPEREARCLGRHDEQRDAIGVSRIARHTRRYHQPIGLIAQRHGRLAALQQPAVGGALGLRGHMSDVMEGARLFMRQRGDLAAIDQATQHRFLLGVARMGHGAAREQNRQCRRERQAVPDGLEHHGDVETLAAVAPIGLAEQRACSAHVAQLLPGSAIKALRLLDGGHAGLEAHLFADEAAERVRQH